jgi:hypothetical protein
MKIKKPKVRNDRRNAIHESTVYISGSIRILRGVISFVCPLPSSRYNASLKTGIGMRVRPLMIHVFSDVGGLISVI